jgi:phosphoglycerate kinase
MKFGINTIDEFDVKGKVVLCRIDINQPIDKSTNTLKDTTRIKACMPTILELSERGAKVVLLAHQGSDIEYKNFYTLEPHKKVLSEYLDREVSFIDDVCGPAARSLIRSLKEGDILLLDNVRFMSEEQTLFEMKLQLTHEEQSQTQVVRKLAPLADLYVCDAFAASHRSQPTLCGFEQLLPSAMGRLFEEEFTVISNLMEAPDRPCVFLLGGAKISDAFLMMESALSRNIADVIITGGLVANILLAGIGENIGSSSMDFIYKSNYAEFIEKAQQIYNQYSDRIFLPYDLAYVKNGKRFEAYVGAIPSDAGLIDVGTSTVKKYTEIIMSAKTVFANGPMGIFEKPEAEFGTLSIWNALGDTEAYTVIGGGDSITAAKKYEVTDKIDYICTGGGALIRFLSGEELPVVKALRYAAKHFFGN